VNCLWAPTSRSAASWGFRSAHNPGDQGDGGPRRDPPGREGNRHVINVGALKSGDDELVLRDIRGVVEACRDGSAKTK